MTGDVRSCLCEVCFYCDNSLSSRHEHDHFPVPKARGGVATVPACINCHDLKDRVSLLNAPIAFVAVGVAEILSVIPKYRRQSINLESPAGLILAVGDYTQYWEDWTVEGRLIYAKILCLSTYESERKNASL